MDPSKLVEDEEQAGEEGAAKEKGKDDDSDKARTPLCMLFVRAGPGLAARQIWSASFTSRW